MPPTSSSRQALEEEFPIFTFVLERYYPDNELGFLADYARKGGEDSLEFQGLGDELSKLVRNPKKAAAFIGMQYNTEITPGDARSLIADFSDRINGKGEFDPRRVETAKMEARVEAAKDPSQLFKGYAGRYIELPSWTPGRLPRKIPDWLGGKRLSGLKLAGCHIPLWLIFVIGATFALSAAAMYATIPEIPRYLAWLPSTLALFGGGLAFISALSMMSWRREIKKPEKAARRRERVAAFSDEKSENASKGWRRFVRL